MLRGRRYFALDLTSDSVSEGLALPSDTWADSTILVDSLFRISFVRWQCLCFQFVPFGYGRKSGILAEKMCVGVTWQYVSLRSA